MNRSKLLIVFIIIGISINLYSQEVSKSFKYFNLTQLGLLAGQTNYSFYYPTNKNFLSVLMINGVSYKNKFNIGFGTGLENIDLINTIPVFIDVRYCFLKKNISPYIHFSSGYSIPLDKEIPYYVYDYKGGVLIETALGVKNQINQNMAFTFSMGYRYQKIIADYPDWINGTYTLTDIYNRVSLRFGLLFM